MKTKRLSVIEARKLVSELIFQVLTERICVREAIKLFPPDIQDPSIQCASYALVHYDADSELRKDPDYAQEQDDYLEMIGFILREGNTLTENIMINYNKYHDMALIPHSKSIMGWFKSLIRFTI